MDGLHNLAGAAAVQLAGKTYRASKLTYGALAEIEAWLLAQRPDLTRRVAAALDHAPARHHEKLLDAAMRQMERRPSVSAAEVRDFLHSFDGASFLLWLMLRDHTAEVASLEQARELAARMDLDELRRKLDEASGLAPLKNSVGREAPAGPAAADLTTSR